MEIANFLRTVPLFTKLEDVELQRFAELTREKSYPKGSVILFEDDPGDSLFIVRDGRVKVVLVGDGEAAIDGGGRRAPVLVQLEADGAGLDLLAQRPRLARIALAEEAQVHREGFGGFQHAVQVPCARSAGGGGCSGSRPGAAAKQGFKHA